MERDSKGDDEMSNGISKEIYDAIARWIADGNLPPRLTQPVAQPVMQPIAYVPKQQPALPELPKLNLPAERQEDE